MEVNLKTNIAVELESELNWFSQVVDVALTLYFKNESDIASIFEISPPSIEDQSSYGQLIAEHELQFEDRIMITLAMAPLLKPQLLDVFKIKNKNLDATFSEFGGVQNNDTVGFIPTLETAFFILAGDNLSMRLELMNRYNANHNLFKKGILERSAGQEWLDQPLKPSLQIMKSLISGQPVLPEFGSKFPAQQIYSKLNWDDLIVNDAVKIALDEMRDWLNYKQIILEDWGLKNSLKQGYRALFYGPPGTGKTLAATLLGSVCQRPVFRIDLSMIVSKYIGETEKNLANLFDMAEGKEWILFFDEADALFGKRTQTKGSNDRYANQEVSYLLQRIEDYPGLVILATNLKDNIDEAFTRRFQTSIQFAKPSERERAQLWEKYIFSKFELADDVERNQIVKDYDVTGGEIINILRFCSIKAARRSEKKLNQTDILGGIKREFEKTSKSI